MPASSGHTRGSTDLDAALDGKPWSVGGVAYGLERFRDTDNRALFEGRAPLDVRSGAPMKLRRCPYDGERSTRWMNVSALAQITSHLDDVLSDITSFRASMTDAPASWPTIYATVMGQLLRPATQLLRSRQRRGAIATSVSVAYKIAAGYVGPVRELLVLTALGRPRAVSSDSLLEFTKQRNHLVGARETCAAPLQMLARVTSALVDRAPGAQARIDPARIAMARTLAHQVIIGVVWQLLDLRVERWLLAGEIGRDRLRGRTQYLERKLDERIAMLEQDRRGASSISVSDFLTPATREYLQSAFDAAVSPSPPPCSAAQLMERLLRDGDGAIELTDPSAAAAVARRFAAYLRAHDSFIGVLQELELELRAHLGFSADVPIKLNAEIFPSPRALAWFEIIVGYRLRGTLSRRTLRNQHRTVSLPGTSHCGSR